MITRQIPVTQSLLYHFAYDRNKTVFFDIETTGLSANTSYLYLIGCIYYQDSSFWMIQWFSEDIHEETALITAFFEFLKDYEILIHYNGSSFDIPYLLKKCFLLNLNYTFDHIICVDLYKRIYPYKKILKLTNCKQKSIEAFLNIKRKDVFSGKDLIDVYQSYLGKKRYETLKSRHICPQAAPVSTESDALLGQLLLHNEDDLKGLLGICPILVYTDLFEKPLQLENSSIEEDQFVLRFALPCPLPVPIRHGNDQICLSACDCTAVIRIHIYRGELKFFYDHYKDYFYLPSEDTAIHKSLAVFVDKAFRKKAKPSTCYTKKQGCFLPQYQPVITPCFQRSYQDKLSFIEIREEFLSDQEALGKYISHILSCIAAYKPE
jgi:uncharacterized protein YprB with RNaseH-like and TPR domain